MRVWHIFCTHLKFWINFFIRNVTKDLMGYEQFHDKWQSGIHTLVKGANEFYPYSVHLMSDFGEISCSDLRVTLLVIYDFHENRGRGGRASLRDINGITFTLVPWENITF